VPRTRTLFVAGGLFALLLGSLAASTSSYGFRSLGSLLGISGKLRAIFALPGEATAEVLETGIRPLQVILLKPFSAKVNGWIGPYHLGSWPFERRAPENPAYANPRGFIEVTPENFRTRVSEHFTLGQFITKDQSNVWPKYLVLEPRLLDKLELTIAELGRRGHPVRSLFVMSGFRTPEYNEQGVGAGGRSAVSRHQYGDAADVYPDDQGHGRMDDLNRDGRVDLRDARILADAAASVEEEHPELVGGVGIYPATSAHGPFVHIDARGKRARW
jgi:hypothetical protein